MVKACCLLFSIAFPLFSKSEHIGERLSVQLAEATNTIAPMINVENTLKGLNWIPLVYVPLFSEALLVW